MEGDVSPRTHALSSCARALVLVEVLTGPGLLQVGAPAAPAEPLGEAEQPPWALRRAQRAALIHKRSTRQRGGELNAVVGAVVSAVLERIGDTDSEGRSHAGDYFIPGSSTEPRRLRL